MSGLSLWTIEDSLATLLGAREELLAESQQPNPTRESAEISTEITEVEKALAEYLAREVAKVDGVHSYLRWAEANASAARVEAQQMAERARRLESGAKRLRQMCCDIMAQRGLKRLEGTGGRVLLRRTDRHGTEWAISVIPLGGYVKMLESGEGHAGADPDGQPFDTLTVARRFAVVVAGPLANLLLSVLLYAVIGVARPGCCQATGCSPLTRRRFSPGPSSAGKCCNRSAREPRWT